VTASCSLGVGLFPERCTCKWDKLCFLLCGFQNAPHLRLDRLREGSSQILEMHLMLGTLNSVVSPRICTVKHVIRSYRKGLIQIPVSCRKHKLTSKGK
jgi:hypothetical protein